LLAKYNEAARPLAGGMSLIPLMKLRLTAPSHIIDIAHLRSLSKIEAKDGYTVIGATTRYVDILSHNSVIEKIPILADALSHIGDTQVRNVGTIGGNLAEADPSGDVIPVAIALNSEIVCRGSKGERTVPASNLVAGPYSTVLEPDELITELRIPTPQRDSASAYLKLERRAGDMAIASVAAQASLDKSGRCTALRLAFGGIASTPVVPKHTETFLIGKPLEEEVVQLAMKEVERDLQNVDFWSDIKAPAWYRSDVVPALFSKALKKVVERLAFRMSRNG
jgi:carbon-monoxide dehydrogenase medium subunit